VSTTIGLIEGAAWVFGDGVNTDAMAPGLYFKAPMAEMARHCLETVNPAFARDVRPGDIVVAGRNFGVGSAREQAAMALQHLGVGAVLAVSFGRIFYRNALNFGVPALFFPQAAEIAPGSRLRVDPMAGHVSDLTAGRDYQVAPLPSHLLAMVTAGGLLPYLKARIESGERWGPDRA
jgi:3-isopropylmalate/(R)-2-methylmalate dehydratase small subunit